MSAEPNSPHRDPELTAWINMAIRYGGSFINSICHAALHADEDNYGLMRPLLLALKAKYPKYSYNGRTSDGSRRNR